MTITSSLQKRPLCLALVLLCLRLAQAALTNITVDDQDPRLMYAPSSSWTRVEGGDLDAGGTHMMTQDVNAFAEISLSFISFYYISALYPYRVTTDIYVDGARYEPVNLRDYGAPESDTGSAGSVASRVVASFTGTTISQHTVRISVPNVGSDSPGYGVLDAFIFTVDEDSIPAPPPSPQSTSTSTSSQPTSTSTTSQPPTTSTSITSQHSSSTIASTSTSSPTPVSAAQSNEGGHKARTLKIALGVAIPIIVILLAFLVWWVCIRKNRRPSSATPLFDQETMGGRPIGGQDGGYLGRPGTSQIGGGIVSAAAFRKSSKKAPPLPSSLSAVGGTTGNWARFDANPAMGSGSPSDAAAPVIDIPPPLASQGGHLDGRG